MMMEDKGVRALPSARATHEPSPDGLGHTVGVANAMSDSELADALLPGEPNALQAIAKLSAQKRGTYERLLWAADELNAGRIPPGVMI